MMMMVEVMVKMLMDKFSIDGGGGDDGSEDVDW